MNPAQHTCGLSGKVDRVKAVGAERVIDDPSQDFAEAIRCYAGKQDVQHEPLAVDGHLVIIDVPGRRRDQGHADATAKAPADAKRNNKKYLKKTIRYAGFLGTFGCVLPARIFFQNRLEKYLYRAIL